MKFYLFDIWTYTPNKGPLQIKAVLERHKIEVVFIQAVDKLDLSRVKEFVKVSAKKDDFLGFSATFLMHFQKNIFDELIALGKELGVKTIVGGSSNLKFDADFDLRGGYREDDLIDLINRQTGRIRKIPFDICSDNFTYTDKNLLHPNTTIPLELTRSCLFNCRMCNYPNRGTKNAPYRDPQLVKDELLSAKELYGSKIISYLCSTLNDNNPKLENVLPVIKEVGMHGAAYMRLDLMMKQKHLWPLIKDTVKHLVFGIETLNHKAAQTIGKGTHPTKVIEYLQEVREYFDDCTLHSGFIVGLPHATLEDSFKEMQFFNKTGLLDGINFNALALHEMDPENVIPYSEFDLQAETYGYKYKESGYGMIYWRRESDGMTYKQAKDLAKYLNEQRKSIPFSFSAAFVNTKYSIEELKQFSVSGSKMDRNYKGSPEVDELYKEYIGFYLDKFDKLCKSFGI